MRRLLVAACLIATICAYHITKHDFHVVIDEIEYKNIPDKYQLSKNALVLPGVEEVLKELIKSGKRPVAGTEAILNDYADKIFTNLQSVMIHDGLDPIQMPEEHSGFNYTLIITYHGELDLTNGWLSDLSTLHRGGDVVASYSSNTKYLSVTIPIAFDSLQFTYDYNAKIMGLGPDGGIAGKINNIGVTVTIGFDVETLKASLDEFYITNSGHIDLNFNGNPLVDWLINLLTDVVTALLKEVILLVVENIIRGAIDTVVNVINSAVDSILNPDAPATTIAPFIIYK